MHYPEKKLQQPNQFLTELKGYVKTSQIGSKQMQPLKLIAQLICYMDQLMCRLAQNLHTLYRQPTLQETSKGNATSQYYGSSDCDLTHLALEPKQIVIPCSNSCICKKTVLSLHWFSFQSSNNYIDFCVTSYMFIYIYIIEKWASYDAGFMMVLLINNFRITMCNPIPPFILRLRSHHRLLGDKDTYVGLYNGSVP